MIPQPDAIALIALVLTGPRHLLVPNGIACGVSFGDVPRRVTTHYARYTCPDCRAALLAAAGLAARS